MAKKKTKKLEFKNIYDLANQRLKNMGDLDLQKQIAIEQKKHSDAEQA